MVSEHFFFSFPFPGFLLFWAATVGSSRQLRRNRRKEVRIKVRIGHFSADINEKSSLKCVSLNGQRVFSVC
jgi:hypothetical protein